jgi:hypothetical protein
LKGVLDLGEFRLRRFGIDDIEHAPLAVAILDRVEYLRNATVERVGKKLARMATICAPFRRACRHPAELTRLHRPRGELRHVVNLDLSIHRLFDEGDHVRGGNPWRTEPCCDVGGLEVRRLHALKRRDIALIGRIKRGRGFSNLQLFPDRTGEVGVSGLPRAIRGVAEDGAAKFGDHVLHIAVHQLGDVVDVDTAALIQHDGERVSRAGDHRHRRRRDDAIGEKGSRLRGVGFEVVILDRGDEPAIGVVKEGLDVRPAMRLAHLAALVVFRHGHGREIDRAKITDEVRPGDAQPDLRVLPRLVKLLRFQHFTHSIADRDQLADDPDVFLRNAV